MLNHDCYSVFSSLWKDQKTNKGVHEAISNNILKEILFNYLQSYANNEEDKNQLKITWLWLQKYIGNHPKAKDIQWWIWLSHSTSWSCVRMHVNLLYDWTNQIILLISQFLIPIKPYPNSIDYLNTILQEIWTKVCIHSADSLNWISSSNMWNYPPNMSAMRLNQKSLAFLIPSENFESVKPCERSTNYSNSQALEFAQLNGARPSILPHIMFLHQPPNLHHIIPPSTHGIQVG